MQRKRQEVDAYNKREFCVLRDDQQGKFGNYHAEKI